MDFDYTKPIPITTVQGDNYPRPQIDSDGRWVVSASAVKQDPNKVVLYDPLSLAIYPVTPYTASLDYYAQVKKYEQVLHQNYMHTAAEQVGYANPDDPHQVNSLADVLMAGSDDWKFGAGLVQGVGKLAQGDLKGAWDEWWVHSDVNKIVDVAKATGELVRNTIIQPIFGDPEINKQLDQWEQEGYSYAPQVSVKNKLWRNALVNLGETMDLITGQNVVRGFIQGTPQGLDKALSNTRSAMGDVYGSGNVQYNWNVNTGNAGLDTLANITLEIATDPTNWISWGTTAVAKNLASKSIKNVLIDASQKSGVLLDMNLIDDLAEAGARAVVYKDKALTSVLSKWKYALANNKVRNIAGELIPPAQLGQFVQAAKMSQVAVKEARTVQTLLSVRSGLDAAQSAAFKATAMTTALGWGYHGIKGTVKLGKWGAPAIARMFNRAVSESGIADATLLTFPARMASAEQVLETFTDVLKLPKEMPTTIARQYTIKYQEEQYTIMKGILSKTKKPQEALAEFNRYAQAHGAADGKSLLDSLQDVKSIVPNVLRSMVADVANDYQKLYDHAITSQIEPLLEQIGLVKLETPDLYAYDSAAANVVASFELGILNEFVSESLQRDVLAAIKNLQRSARVTELTALSKTIASYNLSLLKMPKLFNLGTLVGGKYHSIPQARLREVMLGNPNVNQIVPTMDYHTFNKVMEELEILERIVNKPELSARLLPDVTYIRQMLERWDEDFELITLADVREINTRLVHIQKTIGVIDKIVNNTTPDKVRQEVLVNSRTVIDKYRTVVEELLNKYYQEYYGPSNLGAVYTDSTLEKYATKADSLSARSKLGALIAVNGISDVKADTMRLNIFNHDPATTLDVKHTRELFKDFVALVKHLKDMPGLGYFAKESGLFVLAHEWQRDGFTVALGRELIDRLDNILQSQQYSVAGSDIRRIGAVSDKEFKKSIKTSKPEYEQIEHAVQDSTGKVLARTVPYDYYKAHPEITARYERKADNRWDVIMPVQLMRDEIADLMLAMQRTGDGVVKLTDAALQSQLFQPILSKARSTDLLLQVEQVQEVLAQIRTGFGVGKLIEALEDPTGRTPNAQAIEHLQSLSKSVLVANEGRRILQESKQLAPIWKQGYLDALAGLTQMELEEIRNPEYFASYLSYKAKDFIDNFRGAHMARLHELTKTSDLVEEVTNLHTALFGEDTAYWSKAREAIAENADSNYNVVFSAAQTGYREGTIYEYVQMTPDGKLVRLVDNEVRSSFINALDTYTARKLMGKSKKAALADINNRATKYDKEPYTKVFNTTREFAIGMYNLFKENKHVARDNKTSMRLVGFNNAQDSLGTDEILSRFMHNKKTNNYIVYHNTDYKSLMTIRSFDAAQWLRVQHEDAVVITDTTFNVATNWATKMKELLERTNENKEYALAHLMPNFTNQTTLSFRTLQATLQNALDVWVNPTLPLTELTDEQYAVLRQSFSMDELSEFKQVLTDTLNMLGTSMSTIADSNDELGQWILIQKGLSEHLGIHNVMQLLPKTELGVSPHGYKKVYEPSVFQEWFDLEVLKKHVDVYEPSTLFAYNRVATQLQTIKSKLTFPTLLAEFTKQEMRAAANTFMHHLKNLANTKYSKWVEKLALLTTGTNQVNDFAIITLLWKSIVEIATREEVTKLVEALDTPLSTKTELLMPMLLFPEDSVKFKGSLHTPGIKAFHSELLEVNNYVMQLSEELKRMTDEVDTSTFHSLLETDLMIREETGFMLPSTAIKQEYVGRWGSVVDRLNFLTKSALQWYMDKDILGASERLEAAKLYSARITEIIDMVDTSSTSLNVLRNKQLLSMSAEEYAVFLFTASQGVQVIHMGSEYMLTNLDATTNLMRLLKDAEAYGVEYRELLDTEEIVVFLNPKNAQLPAMYLEHIPQEIAKELADTKAPALAWFNAAKEYFKSPTTAITAEALSGSLRSDSLFPLLAEHLNGMDEFFQGEYTLSMHRMMNLDRYRELREYLPKDVQDLLIPTALLGEYDLIDGRFMQNVIGDYSSGVGNIFSSHSGNLITNLAAGMNVAVNRLQGVDLYASLYYNPKNKLSNWIDRVANPLGVSYKEFRDALKELPYVVAELKDGKVVKVDVSTETAFKKALNSNAVLLDYLGYTRTVEVINDLHINNAFYKSINRNYFSALKLGMILNPATFLRNIVDSISKGLVQAEDAGYLWDMLRTMRNMTAYKETYSKLFVTTQGDMSDKAVRKFFEEHADEVPLDQRLFKNMLTIDTNSVANPTAIQLELSTDLVTKFKKYVANYPEVEEEDIKFVISTFKSTLTFGEAREKIAEVYSEELTDIFMLLRKKMPKQELDQPWFSKVVNAFPITKGLLHINNTFEQFMRMHTALYHTEYIGSGINTGIKATDFSQFNRTRDSKGMRFIEFLFPFSSFQIDNFIFWTETLKSGRHNILALLEDVLSGAWDEEKLDEEELSRNMSLQYLHMAGNLLLDEETGLTMKLNSSLHNTIQALSDPVGTIAEAFNVPMETVAKVIEAINADEAAYDEDSYNNVKPISRWDEEDYTDNVLALVPLIGALWTRWSNSIPKALKLEGPDMILPLTLPGMFGIAKLDSAGTTYEGRPIGTDWYSRDEEYKKTHRYVFGVSYVPAWMSKDRLTYANTLDRLQGMGYSKDVAVAMMQNGWYMKAPDYTLKHYQPNQRLPKARKFYARKVYVRKPRVSRTYPKYNVLPKKQKKFVRSRMTNRYDSFSPDRTRVVRGHKVRRIYRPQLYSNRYTRTGVSRELMITWRGANKSSRQLIRDRSNASRIRTRMQLRQVKPS